MPDQPDEINILVPEHRREAIQQMITRRQAMLAGGGAMAAAYMAGCGGSSGGGGDGGGGGGGGGEETADAPPTPADGQVESGELLMANWVDYSDPQNYKDYEKEFGLKVNVSGFGSNDEILAKLRAGGSKYDIISPTGYAVKTMADLGLIIPLTHELIPNLSNLSPAFKETDYDPGNKYSVAKDYGVTSLLLADGQDGLRRQDHRGLHGVPEDARGQGPARQLPRGRHAGHGHRARRARLLDQHRGRGRDRGGQAAPHRRQAERRHDQLHVHRARDPRRDRLRHGLERRHPPRHRRAGEEGPRDGLPHPGGPDGVLGRQLGHPDRRRAPGRRAQVDQHAARARGGRPGDELPPVPGAGRRDRGRRPRRSPRTR